MSGFVFCNQAVPVALFFDDKTELLKPGLQKTHYL